MNPNLDADLSTTIHKHKANRKQINTTKFLLKKEVAKESDRQKGSDNDSTKDKSKSDRPESKGGKKRAHSKKETKP